MCQCANGCTEQIGEREIPINANTSLQSIFLIVSDMDVTSNLQCAFHYPGFLCGIPHWATVFSHVSSPAALHEGNLSENDSMV
jgi:hypothetical protein